MASAAGHNSSPPYFISNSSIQVTKQKLSVNKKTKFNGTFFHLVEGIDDAASN